ADLAFWNSNTRMSVALFAGESPDHEPHIRMTMARDDAAHFIARREDDTACGFVEVGTRPYVDGCDTSPVGYIEAWYVDPDVRRAGVGRALLDAAEDWAVERGYSEIGSDALLANEVSHRAHRASGYDEVDRVVQYRKPLNAVPVSDHVAAEARRRLSPDDATRFLARIAKTRLP